MLALVALLLCAPSPGQLLDLREGTLSYTVVHKLHEVRASSHQVEGRALAQPDGNVKVQVRVRVATFDSGNSNRDEHMREATHEQSHPYAEVKGTISGVTIPLQKPQETTLRGTVELNGEKRPQDISVKLVPAGGGVRATFAFPVSLDAFKVERPQLLFIKIDDRAIISGDLRFEAAR
jgi:polyisoprenoid-binding protein YceI